VTWSTTEDKAVRVARPREPAWTLRVVYSGEAILEPHKVHALSRGATPIGRQVAGGLSLPNDKKASRHHATLKWVGDALELRDAASRNGTSVNGQPISIATICEGDVLTIGDSLIVVRAEPFGIRDGDVPSLLGAAPAMRAVRHALEQAAPARAAVLLVAPSGCGKELAARALHDHSGREGPFVPVNCAAIPEALAESLLFGHVAGAFTGAGSAAKEGLIRSASGGTLFLDEVGELPLTLQPKLLRFLQDGALLPVGATRPSACHVRIVAATNRDLIRAVERGEFRGDLYARLAQLTLTLPPLGERREDILSLVRHTLGARTELTPRLAEALLLHPWPFNVREIHALAETIRIRAGDLARIDLDLVLDRLQAVRIFAAPAGDAARVEPAKPSPALARTAVPNREQLIVLLRRHGGVISDIARDSGRSRKQIYRWLAEHALDYREYREGAGPKR
jgi:DNA-binding NtrC family response regulator